MAKVFISYSRKDIDFAKRLTGKLQKSELDFWIDWEGIPPTVDWWKEIERGIEAADVFLFLISPDSAKSQICGQEIDCAVKNGKRLIPLVVRDIKDEAVSPHLSHLNWIFFREIDDFEESAQKLLTGIHTDYDWVQTHRRLQVKALEWERNSKEKSFLLRGKDLNDADLQLATNTSKEPHPTDLQREYVFESRKAADRQKRITTVISITGIIALAVLAGLAIVQAGKATDNAKESKRNEATAQAASTLAVSNAETAQAASTKANANANAASTSEAKAIQNAYAAATSQAEAEQSANIASTAQADAENAYLRVQAVAGFRAQALASFSQKAGDRKSPLAALLAIEAFKTATNAQTVARMFELLQQDLVVRTFKSPNGVYVVTFNNPQGDKLAVGYDNRSEKIRLWQVYSSSSESLPLRGHTDGVYTLSFSPDGKMLASGGFDSQILFWDPQTSKTVGNPLTGEHTGRLYSIAFSPDGKQLASGGVDKKIVVWDTVTGKKITQLDGHIDTIFSLDFSPDGRILVSGGKDKKLIFWDMESFKMIGTPIEKHKNFIFYLAFSPDGKTLATADSGGEIFLWDVETRQPIGEPLLGHRGEVSSVAFSPNGDWLASSGYDGRVILWDVATRQQLGELPVTNKSSNISVTFSPDGTLLASGNVDGEVTLWNMQTTFWVEQACKIAGRNLTLAEWVRYFSGETYRTTCSQWPAGQ